MSVCKKRSWELLDADSYSKIYEDRLMKKAKQWATRHEPLFAQALFEHASGTFTGLNCTEFGIAPSSARSIVVAFNTANDFRQFTSNMKGVLGGKGLTLQPQLGDKYLIFFNVHLRLRLQSDRIKANRV